MAGVESEVLRQVPLDALHRALGARMVPFAGYSMPVQYAEGIIAEHLHTRGAAGLFDVSHMGQAFLVGPDHATTARALEALTPGDFQTLAPGRQRYTLLLNTEGGIIDDLMVSRPPDPAEDGRLLLVVNAARKDIDYAHIRGHLPAGVRLEVAGDRALFALQGPAAAKVLARHAPETAGFGFMQAGPARFGAVACHVSRSGYTGEDGFEISVAAGEAEAMTKALLAEPEVKPIGLGARDSLRLEAGLCLYGHDIDETTSPVEAGLTFALSRRRIGEGHVPGHSRLVHELREGPARLRVGIRPAGKAPAREGAEIQDAAGRTIGIVTSGGYGPSVEAPIAMGYVPPGSAAPGTPLHLIVRGRPLEAVVAPLPFVPHRYFRKPAA